MNPLSSQKNSFVNLVQFFLGLVLLAATFLSPTQTVKAQAAQAFSLDPFSRYGFEVSGFTREEEQIIKQTLRMYARALGGPNNLREIITTYSGGKSREITYNPNRLGASTAMELSPTVFSLEKSTAANYSVYAAVDEAAHAQIVIGHEIAHLLVWAVEKRTGVNWSDAYAKRVGRNWIYMDPTAPMEEAVTNISLKVSGAGYFFSMNKDTPETDPRIAAQINAWTVDFIKALRELY